MKAYGDLRAIDLKIPENHHVDSSKIGTCTPIWTNQFDDPFIKELPTDKNSYRC